MPRDNRTRQRVSQACIPCGQRKTKVRATDPKAAKAPRPERRPSIILTNNNNNNSERQLPSRPLPSKPRREGEGAPQQAESSGLRSLSVNDNDSTSTLAGTASSRRDSRQDDPVAVSGEVSAKLFAAYFTKIHPIWPILYMPMHDYSNNTMRSDAFAPAVLYAVYAIAACLELSDPSTPDITEYTSPSPADFFEAAILALQKREDPKSRAPTVFHPLNFIHPSIESCQTLVILSLMQHGMGEASNASMLCNVAAGMAIDLRLHEAPPSNADYVHTQIASRLYWNVYTLDKVLACALSRPFCLRVEDTTIPHPSTAESDEYALLQLRRPKDGEAVRIKSHTLSGFSLTIDIAVIFEDILRETCSATSKQRICKDLAAAEVTRMNLWNRLKGFIETLNRSNLALMLNGTFRPAVTPAGIINTMWAFAGMILVHRPFHFYWHEYNWAPATQFPIEHVPIRACLAAAKDITAIISAYVDDLSQLPADVIFPIVIAAATLWQHSVEVEGEHDQFEVQQKIDLCVKCLSIIGRAWSNAGECQERLIRDFGSVASESSSTYAGSQTQHNSFETQPMAPGPGLASMAHDVSAAQTMPMPGSNNGFGPVPMEVTYPFLDILGPKIDEFGSSDEGFRSYLETQLNQQGFPDFSFPPTGNTN
ncbi:hypothetical protein Q7P37_007805 [Cladosporium fusiforme]